MSLMEYEQELLEIFENGMINGVFYSDKYMAVYQAFCYFSQSGLMDKDLAKFYKVESAQGVRNIPRLIAMWLIENKKMFAKVLNTEIKSFEDMLIFCIPMYHPDLVVMLDKGREDVLSDWFADNLTPALAIKYFDELKSIFMQLNFEYKKKYPGYIETLALSFINETSNNNFMYQIAQNIQDRIMEKGYIEFDDVKEIKENGIPYYWLGTLMEQLDETNLELFIKACVDTLDENIITEYMKYFYKTNNNDMIKLLSEKSFEIKEKNVLAFSDVKKFEMDFKYHDVVIDTTPEYLESVEKFAYKGSHVNRYPNNAVFEEGVNPFDSFIKEGKWFLVTSGHTNLDVLEMNVSMNLNTQLTIWVLDNPNYVPKYLNIQYVIGSETEAIRQIKRIMGMKI